MRFTILSLAGAIVLLAACSAQVDRPTAVSSISVPFARSSGVPNTDGLPDLIVDEKATQQNWLVRVEDLPSNFCSVVEGGVTPGTHTVIRFTVTTPNVGTGDVYIGDPISHMDPNGDGNYADSDGLYELSTCHNHFHFQQYATYRLIDASGKVWKAAKRGFCMLDTDPYNTNNGDGTWTYRSCGTTTRSGFQGISTGWADTYMFFLGGQYFVLDGGDGQPVVPPGSYTIEIVVNPPYAADRKGNCPRVKDAATGLCHQFAESDYSNNVGRVNLVIPDHPGRTGYGPLKNNNTKITAESEQDHKGQ